VTRQATQRSVGRLRWRAGSVAVCVAVALGGAAVVAHGQTRSQEVARVGFPRSAQAFEADLAQLTTP